MKDYSQQLIIVICVLFYFVLFPIISDNKQHNFNKLVKSFNYQMNEQNYQYYHLLSTVCELVKRKNCSSLLHMSSSLVKSRDLFQLQTDKITSTQESLLLTESKAIPPIKSNDHLIQSTKLQQIKQVQQYRRMSQQLNTMHRLNKANSQKLRNLQKSVFNLDFLRRLSFKQTLKIKNKRQKLQQTQSIFDFMSKLKQEKMYQDKQKLHERKKLCTSLRQSMLENRSLSMSHHQNIKQESVRLFKDKKHELLQSYQKSIENLLEQNRQKAQNIRLSQLRLKQKFKRYDHYKVYLGRLNYEKKLQQQNHRHTQNVRQLRNLQHKMKEEDKILRKTQRVGKQTQRIQQDFYLTGTGNIYQ